jgi:putative ABC transport system substrate-binding protein
VDQDKGINMKREITVLTLCAMLFAFSFPARSQQQEKVPRIGFLSNLVSPTPTTPDLVADAFSQGLRDLGYIQGKNIVVEYRYSEGMEDRLPGLAAELLQLKVDVLVSASLRGIRAAKQATKTIPIVIVTTADPVAAGLVDSLARPGGNITGLTRLTRDLSGKRLDLLKEVIPRVSRVGVLSREDSFQYYESKARALNIQFFSLEVRSPNPDFEGAFQTAVKGRVSAIIIPTGFRTISHQKWIAELAKKNRIPSMCERSDYVEAGCLMSYSADEAESYRRAATYVDKILKGAKPADLPVEQPTKFELVINLKTAKQIGLTIPPNVLVRADKVIK